MTQDNTPEDISLAAEYVLRLLDEAEFEAVGRRLRRDTKFAILVQEWRGTFGRMDDSYPEEEPSRGVKTALLLSLFGRQDPAPSFFKRLGVWRFGTAALLALSVGLGSLLYSERTAPAAALYVADLAAEADALVVLAVYNDQTKQVQITRTAGAAGSGRSLQLWGIAQGQAPVSIGVLPANATASLPLPPALAEALDGLTLAISDEPLGGSPTGQPTGAVLAARAISKL